MELTPAQRLACALVRRPSVTPEDNGCQELLRNVLEPLGFECVSLGEHGAVNLLALHGAGKPFTLFLGHTDVVPAGDPALWDHDPFCGGIFDYDGVPCLYGRGSADMKGGDAAMTVALSEYVRSHPRHRGTAGLLVTSNEEGDAAGGTPLMVEYLKERGLVPDYCLLAECSSDEVFGDAIKNGRRGDCNYTITVHGVQGHVAQEQYADNAVHAAARLITALMDDPLDHGSADFPPSSFQVSNIAAGTGADNVIPGSCRLRCNTRYNDQQNLESIQAHVLRHIEALKLKCDLEWQLDGLPFVTPSGRLIDTLSEVIVQVLGLRPALGASGGTSDARFIRPLGTQTAEFGPVGKTIHQANERVPLEVLERLKDIYRLTLERLQG